MNFVLIIIVSFVMIVSVCYCCTELRIVVTCLPPMIICTSNNDHQRTLHTEFPGFAIEFLNQTIQMMNNHNNLFCSFSNVSILHSPSDFIPLFQQFNFSTEQQLLVGINGISNSLLTSTFMKESLPYAYSRIRAFGVVNSHRIPLELTALRFFTQPIFYEFFGAWLLLCLVFANILWCAERILNSEQFEREYFQGLFNSFYFSTVTTTTVGYGDKTAHTCSGKVLALGWLLISFVIIFLFNATATSFVTVNHIRNVPETILEYTGRTVATFPFSKSADLLHAAGADVVLVNDSRTFREFFSDQPLRSLLLYDQVFLGSNFTDLIRVAMGFVGPFYDTTEYSYLLQKNNSVVDPYLEELNAWILRMKNSPAYRKLAQKYFQQDTPPLDVLSGFFEWLPFLIFAVIIGCIALVYIIVFSVSRIVRQTKQKALQQPIPPSTLESHG